MVEISCQEIGVIDCAYTARGKTPGEVLKKMVDHLRADHGLDMPDAEDILNNPQKPEDSVLVIPEIWINRQRPLGEEERLVTERLVNLLNLSVDS
jgi:predicted small metal-binding protein